jgi:hypothetical protein
MTENEDRLQRIAEKRTARIQEYLLTRGGVDLFLWRGSKDPKLVQRFGARILSLFTASLDPSPAELGPYRSQIEPDRIQTMPTLALSVDVNAAIFNYGELQPARRKRSARS